VDHRAPGGGAVHAVGCSRYWFCGRVRLEGDGTDTTLVVLFHSDDRPECQFGWRIPIWPGPAPDDPVMGTPERWGHRLSFDLVELVEASPGLPALDPDPHGITGS